MTPPPRTPPPRIVVLFVAIPLEAAPLRAALDATSETLPGAVRAWRGRFGAATSWIVQTGIGASRAAAAAEAAIARLAPDVVVSTGCAAALRGDLVAGDVVVATGTASREGVAPSDEAWAAVYERAAREGGLRVERGRIWTADALVASPEAKRRLAARSESLAVEMEGAAIAAAAARSNVRFVAVRTILDGFDLAIPEGLVDERGRVRPLRVAAALARDPRLVRTLGHLRAAAARSADALGRLHAQAARLVTEDRPVTQDRDVSGDRG